MAPRTTAPPASPKASDYPLIPDAYLRDPSNPASYADCAAVDSDLTIDKTGPATFQTGQKFSHPYTITVWNKGPAAVRNATLADTLPDT